MEASCEHSHPRTPTNSPRGVFTAWKHGDHANQFSPKPLRGDRTNHSLNNGGFRSRVKGLMTATGLAEGQ